MLSVLAGDTLACGVVLVSDPVGPSGIRMKCFVVLIALATLASADVSLGYKYKVPHTSYGVPTYQPSGGSFNLGAQSLSSGSTGSASQSYSQPQYQIGGGYQNAGAFQGLQGGSFESQGYQGSQQGSGNVYENHYKGSAGHAGYHQPGGSLAYQTGSSSSVQTGTGSLNYLSSGLSQTSNQFQSADKASALSSYQQYYQQAQRQPPQVFKHFYVHAAPEEPEVPRFRQPQVLPPPQKHYKIIFIKTPTPPAPPPQFFPVQQQNEEKTIVYVLVKKPEEAEDIVIPKVEQKPPSKPEVYFIKYNAKEGSQGAINNIVSDFGGSGQTFGGSSGESFSGSSEQAYGTSLGQSFGSGPAAGSTFTDGALSEIGSSTVSSNLLSGGSSSGGSFSVAHGSAESDQVQTHGASGYVSAPSAGAFHSATSNEILAGNTQSGGESQLTETASGESQAQSFQSVGASQGLPHSSYGPPNFRS